MDLIEPIARIPIAIRTATRGDVPTLRFYQQWHGGRLERFAPKELEAFVADGEVLVAHPPNEPYKHLGTCIWSERCQGRDEVAIIHQVCAAPLSPRLLIGTTLVKAAIERAKRFCRLMSCWCAQDVTEANLFWEALGFAPIAFRVSGRVGQRQRVFLFWQRRTYAADPGTPWWFPFQSTGGTPWLDRLVFAIPPGVGWRDVKPIEWSPEQAARLEQPKAVREKKSGILIHRPNPHAQPPGTVGILVGGRIKYVPRTRVLRGLWFAPPPTEPAPIVPPAPAKPPRKPSPTLDPKVVASMRELKDRSLGRINSGLHAYRPIERGKYEVGRLGWMRTVREWA